VAPLPAHDPNLIGYKWSEFAHAIYVPYIPLYTTEILVKGKHDGTY
jgi:hypothetical protein